MQKVEHITRQYGACTVAYKRTVVRDENRQGSNLNLRSNATLRRPR